MKTCSKCKKILSKENAHQVLTGKRAGEFQSYCKLCGIDYAKKRYAINPQPAKESYQRWFNKPGVRSKRNDYARDRRAEFPEKIRSIDRNSKLKKAYGISLLDFNRLLDSQKGVCKICSVAILGEELNSKKLRVKANVDHCHKTGKVRGLLCLNCNLMLGHSGDSPSRLIAAAAYLQKTP